MTKPKRKIGKFRLDEISLVDRPAHTPARIAIMKRAADTAAVIEKNAKMAVTTLTAGHAHTIVMVSAGPEGMAELRAGRTSYADGHVHDWIMDDAGNVIIADAEGHTHGLAVLVTKNEDSLDADVLAAADQILPASDNAATGGNPEITNMTPEEQKAALAKAAADQKAAEDRAARAESIVKLSAEQRAHFDALDTAGQDEFLKASDKDAIVKNAKAADPVVYTRPDGTEIRKSAGDLVLSLAKQADDQAKELAAERALRKASDLKKRGSELLKSCKGSDEVKGALLGAVEGIADETLRKGALEILTAKDAGLAKAFEQVGTSDDGNGEGADADAKLNELAKAHQAKNPGMSFEKAYTAVLFTDEGKALEAQRHNR